jgi:hypothetical protein
MVAVALLEPVEAEADVYTAELPEQVQVGLGW